MTTKSGPVYLDRSRQVAVQVYEILKERILSVTLTPGTVLSRAMLQDEFGISQTPVRDALLHLQEDGLVDIYPQHATLVSQIDIAHARQAQFLRLSVELEAVRRITADNAGPTADALETILRQQESVSEPATFNSFDALDRAFHRVLYNHSHNAELWDVIRRQSVHLDRLRRLNLPMPGKMRAVLQGHREILDAIRTGDGSAATIALRAHLSGTLSIIDEIKERHPDYIRESERTIYESSLGAA